jgi:SAM-dependent methyltransferase
LAWEIFERQAGCYQDWYTTARGRHASREETELLGWLLARFPRARTFLEVGCGTGQFTAWLAARGLHPIGLDRAPAMLARARRRLPECPILLADAHSLPVEDRAVDLVVFVTTIEFLEYPERALAEAVRSARRGLVAVVLNRWSAGALSRRWGSQSRGTLLRHARDLSLRQVRGLFEKAAGSRLTRLCWRSALPPFPVSLGPVPIPLGDVLGITAELEDSPLSSCRNSAC